MVMRRSVLLLAASAMLLLESEARTWLDVVDPALYASSIVDKNQIQYSLEADPFDFSTSAPTTLPTKSPTLSPVESSAVPSAFRTDVPSQAPSVAPTGRWEFVSGNGGCADGEHLYVIRMHDAWGDGWDNTTMKITTTVEIDIDGQETGIVHVTNSTEGENSTVTISEVVDLKDDTTIEAEDTKKDVTIFEGGLEKGSDGYSYVCLKSSNCYSLAVDGGQWLNEIKWEIREVPPGLSQEEFEGRTGHAAAKGLAPAHCQFSFPDKETGGLVCPFSCEATSSAPSEAPTMSPTVSPTSTPTAASSPVPTIIEALVEESNAPGDAASQAPSDSPSNVPSTSPSLAFGNAIIVAGAN